MNIFSSVRNIALASMTFIALSVEALEVGKPAPDFTAINANGEKVSLSSYKGKTVILEWTNHQCPFVKKHYSSGNMQDTQKYAAEQGAVWLSIISSAPGKQGHVSPEKANKLSSEREAAPTEVVLDESGEIGKLYSAKTTPHMFIIDASGAIQYMGAIDSTASASPSDIPDSTNYVKKALQEMGENKKVSEPKTRPYGCSVKYSA